MPRPDPPTTNPLLGKAFLDSLFAEFEKKPHTLEQELKNLDEIIAVEKNHLDNPDPDITREEHYEEPYADEYDEQGNMEARFREEKARGGIRQAELDYEGE